VTQQRQVFLGLLTRVELLAKTVVGQTEAGGREEVLAIRVVGEGSGLTHQRIDHVPVMHRVLVPTDESRQRVGQHVRVPDLDAVGVEPGLHPLTDQPAMHRVGTAVNVDQASRIDAARHLQTTGQTHVGQVLQRRDLFGEAITPTLIATLHNLLEELGVLLAAGEVPAATHQECLVDGGFEMVVRRFRIAILVRLPDVDPLTGQTVVIQQIAIARLEFPRLREIVHRRAEAVAAMPPRHAAEFPQGVLQAFGECLKRLRRADTHRFPIRIGQDEVVDQVIEWLPLDGDAEGIHVREIGGGEVADLMDLPEDGEFAGSVARTPLPDAAFKGAAVGIEELAGVVLAEPVKKRFGQELRFGLEFHFDLGPHPRKRIDPCTIGACSLLANAGERRMLAVMPGRLLGHPCPPGRYGQRSSLLKKRTQFSNLAIRDHRRSPSLRDLPVITNGSGREF
jgi:hypothetical protein